MPQGLQRQKRPADAVANAIRVAKILSSRKTWKLSHYTITAFEPAAWHTRSTERIAPCMPERSPALAGATAMLGSKKSHRTASHKVPTESAFSSAFPRRK